MTLSKCLSTCRIHEGSPYSSSYLSDPLVDPPPEALAPEPPPPALDPVPLLDRAVRWAREALDALDAFDLLDRCVEPPPAFLDLEPKYLHLLSVIF